MRHFEQVMKHSVGDKVRISGNSNAHGFEIGDVVTITKIEPGVGAYRAESEGDFWFVNEDDILSTVVWDDISEGDYRGFELPGDTMAAVVNKNSKEDWELSFTINTPLPQIITGESEDAVKQKAVDIIRNHLKDLLGKL